MSLLLMQVPGEQEGPAGYRLRLAEANLLPQSWLDIDVLGLDGECAVASPVFQRWRTLNAGGTVWVNRRARWCSVCLDANALPRIGWELLFADACAACGHWLQDVCAECGDAVTWRRDMLLRCPCGASLAQQSPKSAPSALARLSRTLEQLALGQSSCELTHLRGLSVGQCQRLVRVMGAYGGSRHQRAPQKISGADTLDVSWTVTTVAAEILDQWPTAFHRFLSRQVAESTTGTGRMPGVFGGFYRALYMGLKEPEFDWVRQAFEEFIAEHWTGAIGRRNRRIPDAVRSRLAWMPGPEAARQAGVSSKRLQYLVDSGAVKSISRVSAAGRAFMMVRREDIDAISHPDAAQLTLAQAATHLGIKRQRLSKLIPLICPEALKVTLQGTPWLIPRLWVDDWLNRLGKLKRYSVPPDSCVTLDHILRYGPLGNAEIALVLSSISTQESSVVGVCVDKDGLAGMLFDRRWLIEEHGATLGNSMSVTEAARRLGVKQEVAYALIRLELLAAENVVIGRRRTLIVPASSLHTFSENYVLAAELARSHRRSPKAMVTALTAEGVTPSAGPDHGGCRQIVYARDRLNNVSWLKWPA